MSRKQKKESSYTQSEPIYSGAKSTMFTTWFAAVVLSAFSYPIINVGFERAANTGVSILLTCIVLLALLFIYFAVKETIDWISFGKTPLYMDPPIGSIGGQVGGTIVLNRRYEEGTRFKVTLSNVHYYTTSKLVNGKHITQDHNETVWEDEGDASFISEGTQSAVQFCFNIPSSAESTKGTKNKGYYWKLKLSLEDYKHAFVREFSLPVKTGKRKSNLKLKPLNDITKASAIKRAKEALPLQEIDGNIIINYPSFYLGDVAKGFWIFGGVFAGIGLGILVYAEAGVATFVGDVFSIIGWTIIGTGVYEYVLARKILINDDCIEESAYLFSYELFKKTISRDAPFSIKTLGMFNQKIKKNRHESFAHIVMTQDDKKLYLARYVQSITQQKNIKKMFYDKLKYKKEEE